MKFVVARASQCVTKEEEPPCEGATFVPNGKFERPQWTVEIESIEALIAFCKKHGDVVISEGEPLPILLIYDSYIE